MLRKLKQWFIKRFKRRFSMKNTYVADFETTTDPLDTRVWAWGLYNIEKDRFEHGTDLDSFFNRIIKLPNSSKVYFHNLKFDGEFFQYALYERGFTHTEERKLENKEYSTLISHMGQFFSLKIKDRNKQINFIDSLKIIPLSVEQIARAFNTPMLKGEIDYHMFREVGYKPTKEEIEYVKNDVAIVANALKYFFNAELTKQTIASNALTDYKKLLGKKNFEMYFPVLEQDKDLRQSYKGGFTYVSPRFQGKDIESGIVLDVNSLYSSVMYNEMLPYGEPIYYEGEYQKDKIYSLYIQTIRCNFELKPNHIPTIQIKKSLNFKPTEYLTDSNGLDVTLCLTSVDLELMFEHYEIYNLEFFGGWKFKATNKLFISYIDKWVKIKVQATIDGNKGLRQIAKLMLNSLYGKFGLNPVVKSKIPSFDKEKRFINYTTEKEGSLRDPLYIPIASFITSYARRVTITGAQKNFDRFIYADTDSLHLIGTEVPNNLLIDGTKMGYWDLEATFEKAKFLRAKTYVEVVDGVEHFTVAGAPDKTKQHMTFENFKIGQVYDGKLQQKRVSGGTVLVDKKFTLKDK